MLSKTPTLIPQNKVEYLEKIIAHMPGHVYWKDKNGILLGCNDEQAKSLGLKSRFDIIGLTAYDTLPKDFADEVTRMDQQVMRSRTALMSEEIMTLPNGEKSIWLSKKVPLFDDNNEVIGILGISFDITSEKEVQSLKLEKFQAHEQFVKICAQVAHDIRSPSAALEILTKYTANIPEKERTLLRHAVARINDIANNLITVYQGKKLEDENSSRTYLLSSVLHNLISEKRLQFQDHNLEILTKISPGSTFSFAKINLIEFKRVLSNLINNAVEALPSHYHGLLCINLYKENVDNLLHISIQDNGKGIPETILKKLGQEAISHGKEGGLGLGLSHAFATMKKLQGNIKINSILDKGTEIILTLPEHPCPVWFAKCLTIPSQATVVILDDDEAIHYGWDVKFKVFISTQQIQLKHFHTPEACLDWLELNKSHSSTLYFLFDYELLGSPLTGLDVIKKYPHVAAVLVTSRFEEPTIINQCEALNLKLLPKNLATEIEIEIRGLN